MAPRQRRQVSMSDVAQLAGVSTQTVSRVSNGFEGVVPATRDRVIAAMRELGYRPNAAARALKRGSFKSIGVVMFNLNTTGSTSMLAAISESAYAHGYSVTLMTEHARTSESVTGAFDRLQEMAVDGMVLVIDFMPEDDSAFTLPDVEHLVVVDSSMGDRHAVVDTDHAAGARLAVEHLLGLGHHTVHHLAGPKNSYIALGRESGWREALEAAGCTVPKPSYGDWSSQSGYEAAAALLDDPDCSAVFCANDEMALGLLRAARERGVEVPRDLSIVGFDDIPMSASFFPPLTTVHQDFEAMGRACVERLMTMIETGEPQLGPQWVAPSLVVRSSTAAPAS